MLFFAFILCPLVTMRSSNVIRVSRRLLCCDIRQVPKMLSSYRVRAAEFECPKQCLSLTIVLFDS